MCMFTSKNNAQCTAHPPLRLPVRIAGQEVVAECRGGQALPLQALWRGPQLLQEQDDIPGARVAAVDLFGGRDEAVGGGGHGGPAGVPPLLLQVRVRVGATAAAAAAALDEYAAQEGVEVGQEGLRRGGPGSGLGSRVQDFS